MVIRPATPADVPAVLLMVASVCALHESWDAGASAVRGFPPNPQRGPRVPPLRRLASKYGFLPNLQERDERWLISEATSDRSVFLVAEDEAQSAEQPGQLVAFLVATVEREYHGRVA